MRIEDFLLCPTPKEWITKALTNLDLLLVDHAHCERKAAMSALSMMNSYPTYSALSLCLSRLAREELLHYEKVLDLLNKRQIVFYHLKASQYATKLHRATSREEPQRLIDKLILGAIIEARSSERFQCLIPHLDEELASFYHALVKSETRHFLTYLDYASDIHPSSIDNRVMELLTVEKTLIVSKDTVFRFHSGI